MKLIESQYEFQDAGVLVCDLFTEEGYLCGRRTISNGACYDSLPAGTVLWEDIHKPSQGITIKMYGGVLFSVPEKEAYEESLCSMENFHRYQEWCDEQETLFETRDQFLNWLRLASSEEDDQLLLAMQLIEGLQSEIEVEVVEYPTTSKKKR